MKLTKYGQSCVIVEGDGRLLIDLGSISKVDFGDLGTIDGVLFTHRHADHLDENQLDAIRQAQVPMWGNADVVDVVGEGITTVADQETFEAAGFEIQAFDLPHVEMVDGSPGPPNTGFVMDGSLLHPGDAIEPPNVSVEHACVPIAGPSISNRDAYVMAEKLGVTKIVPIHYDFFPADPNLFAQWVDFADVHVLEHGKSVHL